VFGPPPGNRNYRYASHAWAIGDLDGDGKLDAVGALGQNKILVWLDYLGTTLQRAPVEYAIDSRAVSVLLADLNGDRKLDIIVAGTAFPPSTTGNVSVLLNNGSGLFFRADSFRAGSQPVSIALADFTGDGKPDLAVASAGNLLGDSGSVALLRGNGDGTFQAPQQFSAGTNPRSVLAGDFNGDGRLDLAVASSGSADVSILIGNGSGGFGPVLSTSVGMPADYLAAGDLDGDGKLDVVALESASNTMSLLRGLGDGTLVVSGHYLAGRGAQSLALIDLPNFSGPSILSPDTTAAEPHLQLLNPSGGGRFDGIRAYYANPGTRSVAVADFNRDGRLDMVTADSNRRLSVLLNSGGGVFQNPSTMTIPSGATSPSNATSVTTGDFNGDGIPDIAAVNDNFSFATIFLGRGDGTFQVGRQYSVATNPVFIVSADVNQDGKLDLVIANNGQVAPSTDNGNVALLLGNGDGTFQTPVQYFSAGVRPVFLAAGDFNGDGRMDVAVVSQGNVGGDPGGVQLLLGNTAGSMDGPLAVAVGGINPTSAVAVDLNGDGKLDLAVNTTRAGGQPGIIVTLGAGNGTFQQVAATTAAGPGFTAAGDFDGDGKMDLVVARCCGAGDLTMLGGRGDGTFRAPVVFAAGQNPRAMAVGDFNGDGRADIAAAYAPEAQQSAIAVLINNLAVAGTPVSHVSAASLRAGPVAPDSIVTAFGARLSTSTTAAPSPSWPLVLGGTSVRVRDAAGADREAPIAFVSPGQVNYLMPAGTAPGRATVTITSADGAASSGAVEVTPLAPGIFVANSGTGLAAALVLRVSPSGAQSVEFVAQVDSAGQIVPAPIDLGGVGEQVYLLLFGTGIRGRTNLSGVTARVGGVNAPVSYAGAQGQFPGLDQVNALLPRSLAGSGNVEALLTAEGVAANPVRITIR
jgi:uncharacterized protein (TIGR03437 family)